MTIISFLKTSDVQHCQLQIELFTSILAIDSFEEKCLDISPLEASLSNTVFKLLPALFQPSVKQGDKKIGMMGGLKSGFVDYNSKQTKKHCLLISVLH